MSGDDFRRRRRRPAKGPRRAARSSNFNPWIGTAIAAIVVIVGGWFLGQGLAQWLSPKERQVTRATRSGVPAITPVPSPMQASALPTVSPTPQPTAAASTAAAPKRSSPPTFAPTLAPTMAPTVTPTLAPTVAPTTAPIVTPTAATVAATIAATQRPRATMPVARRPESSPQQSAAAQTVRSYVDALRRGDPQAAASYLANGSPDEAFIDANTRITNVTSTSNADGSSKVAVDMQTAKGEYFETFIVASGSGTARILERTAIKP